MELESEGEHSKTRNMDEVGDGAACRALWHGHHHHHHHHGGSMQLLINVKPGNRALLVEMAIRLAQRTRRRMGSYPFGQYRKPVLDLYRRASLNMNASPNIPPGASNKQIQNQIQYIQQEEQTE